MGGIGRKVCWLSAGVSSFVAAYLSDGLTDAIYIDINDQHPDSKRFIDDCSKVLGLEVQILRSEYGSVENACKTFGYINGVGGAKCTQVLKRRVRKVWEHEHKGESITYVWGFDCTERGRAERVMESMPGFMHEFPIIEANLTKDEAHGICERLGVKRPMMYDLGYRNNNCIGCVKGGMGYWNMIRRDFPDVFESRSRMEREIGHSCINGVFLDELDEGAGRNNEVVPECGIMCELSLIDGNNRR